MLAFTILSIAFILIGGIVLLTGITLFKHSNNLKNEKYDSVSATITDIIEKKSSGSSKIRNTYYFAVLDFVYNGYNYSVKSNTNIPYNKTSTSYSPDTFSIGDRVTARIYHNDINSVIIDSPKVLNVAKTGAIIFMSIGGLFTVLGLIFLIVNILLLQ